MVNWDNRIAVDASLKDGMGQEIENIWLTILVTAKYASGFPSKNGLGANITLKNKCEGYENIKEHYKLHQLKSGKS
jgi:hypothetical protein